LRTRTRDAERISLLAVRIARIRVRRPLEPAGIANEVSSVSRELHVRLELFAEPAHLLLMSLPSPPRLPLEFPLLHRHTNATSRGCNDSKDDRRIAPAWLQRCHHRVRPFSESPTQGALHQSAIPRARSRASPRGSKTRADPTSLHLFFFLCGITLPPSGPDPG